MILVQNNATRRQSGSLNEPQNETSQLPEDKSQNPPDLNVIITQTPVNPLFNASDSSGINYRIDPNLVIGILPTVTDRNCPVNDVQIRNAKLAEEQEKAEQRAQEEKEEQERKLAEQNKINIQVEVNAAHEHYFEQPNGHADNARPRHTGKCAPCVIF